MGMALGGQAWADAPGRGVTPPRSVVSAFANFQAPIAGVAGDKQLVFVGQPLSGSVAVLARSSGRKLGELPLPPLGFALPFIIHTIGEGKVAVLDAGGLPAPAPFTPAKPVIYEYEYSVRKDGGFNARLSRTVSFDTAFIGFSEDFVRLKDGRYLISDAVLGSVWVALLDGTVVPGIVPKSFDAADAIRTLALCPTMPQVTVNGYPFLFTGSTLPGISPLAVRDGKVYYYSPCARGIYSFPLAILSDDRQPWERAADIRLVAPTPSTIEVEELLDFSFNPFDPSDSRLYAANPLALQLIRVDLKTGARQVLAQGASLLDFPSSLAFLPPDEGREQDDAGPTLLVVSNQQERSPLTNDAVRVDSFSLPFIVSKVRVSR